MASDSILIFGAISTVIATLIAPLLAVQAQKYLERERDSNTRRLNVFKTLMATRASRVTPQHVEALNMIDVEFHAKRFRNVIDSWQIYRDHLNNFPKSEGDPQKDIWWNKCFDLFTDVLFEIGKSLNYDFDKVHIKRSIYIPEGLGEIDRDVYLLRKALISLLSGENAIKMRVVDFPNMEDSEGQKAVLMALSRLIDAAGKVDSLSEGVFGRGSSTPRKDEDSESTG